MVTQIVVSACLCGMGMRRHFPKKLVHHHTAGILHQFRHADLNPARTAYITRCDQAQDGCRHGGEPGRHGRLWPKFGGFCGSDLVYGKKECCETIGAFLCLGVCDPGS